jgi:hypothetical protein
MIRRSGLVALAATVLAFGLITTAEGRPVGTSGPARSDSGIAYFSITHDAKGLEYAAGNVTDKVFGTSAITYVLKIVSSKTKGSIGVKATKVVLYTATGSLSGTATATINNISSATQTITNGKLKLDKGAGALKGAKLTAKFSGTSDLTNNTLVFHYTGELVT